MAGCPSCYPTNSIKALKGMFQYVSNLHYISEYYTSTVQLVWLGGRVVRTLDLRSTGREFESRPLRYQVQPWASCQHTHVPLSPSSIIWYQPMGGDGKVTVGLASHWPCVTDNSGITTYGLMALEREMSTPPIPSRSMAQFTFTFTVQSAYADSVSVAGGHIIIIIIGTIMKEHAVWHHQWQKIRPSNASEFWQTLQHRATLHVLRITCHLRLNLLCFLCTDLHRSRHC